MSKIRQFWDQLFRSGKQITGKSTLKQSSELPKEPAKQQFSPPRPSQKRIAQEQVSQKTLTISEKLATLKETLEFEQDVKSRLDEIHSNKDLLLYVHEVLLFKFLRLREIGMLSPKSSKAVEALNRRFTNVLMTREPVSDGGGQADVDDILRENESLKMQIDTLRDKHLKQGIITERELRLEEESDYLKRRLRETNSQLEIVRKKAETFMAAQEMLRDLRVKNSLLGSRVEHQANLLRSLAADNTKQQEYISAMERLKGENNQLKAQLEKQSGVLDQLQQLVPENSSWQEPVKQLMNRHNGLLAELEERATRFEHMAEKDPEKSLSESFDRLQDENLHIKSLLATRQSINNLVRDRREGEEDPEQVIEILRSENQRLEQVLLAKKQQIKVLASAPSNRGLVKALGHLQEENKQLLKENGNKEAFLLQLEREKKLLLAEIHRLTPQVQEARRIKAELEFNKGLVESLKKVEFKHDALRKKYSELQSQYEATLQKSRVTSQKLEKLFSEHTLLIAEYENLFGGGRK